MSEKLTHQESLPLEERFVLDPDDFPIFSRQANSKGLPEDINITAEKYVKSTAELIAALDGTSTETNEKHPKPDHVIYLDKSARPVSWLVNVFWDDFSQSERPPHSYLNIDRINWFRRTGAEINSEGNGHRKDGSFGRLGFEDFDTSKVSPADLAGIRALFIEGGVDTADVDTIMNTPTILDGKNIFIVDEVKNSGSTLLIAQNLLERAIPETKSTRGDYFWDSSSTKIINGETQMGSSPVWYDSKTERGRGIGDVREAYQEEQYQKYPNKKTLARKLGAFVLGSPIGPDSKSRELMSEIKLLEQAYRDGHILFLPPLTYDNDRIAKALATQGFPLDADGAVPEELRTFIKRRDQEKSRR